MPPHPHFDGGSLDWQTRWEDAAARARDEGKLVFVEMGRELCSNCRSLVEVVCRQPGVEALLTERFVPLASDCDDPEPQVLEMAMASLAGATMLPFVLFADPDGNVLGSHSGAVDPASFQEALESLAN